jgi:hypothetical protein
MMQVLLHFKIIKRNVQGCHYGNFFIGGFGQSLAGFSDFLFYQLDDTFKLFG